MWSQNTLRATWEHNHLWSCLFLNRFLCSSPRGSDLVSLGIYVLKSFLGVANTQGASPLGLKA